MTTWIIIDEIVFKFSGFDTKDQWGKWIEVETNLFKISVIMINVRNNYALAKM